MQTAVTYQSAQLTGSIPASGALSFGSPPDYENPRDANGDNIYLVTVQASDGTTATVLLAVAVYVTNADDPGTVIFGSTEPVVEIALTVSVTDPDGSISETTLGVGQLDRRVDGVGGHQRGDLGQLHPGRRRSGQLPAGDNVVHRRARFGRERREGLRQAGTVAGPGEPDFLRLGHIQRN